MEQWHGSYEPLPEEKGTYQNPHQTTEVTDIPNKAASVKQSENNPAGTGLA